MIDTERPTETVVVLDFGSQYAQLIVRRVREQNVYCLRLPHDAPESEVMALSPKGFILSGGPASVYEPGAPKLPSYLLESGLPASATGCNCWRTIWAASCGRSAGGNMAAPNCTSTTSNRRCGQDCPSRFLSG